LTAFSLTEKLPGDVAVAHALGHPSQDLKLTAGDAGVLSFSFAWNERFRGRQRDFLDRDAGRRRSAHRRLRFRVDVSSKPATARLSLAMMDAEV
jgi:hypothetical protein